MTAKSIMQDDKTKCYLCGRNGNGDPLEAHHCIGGINRKHSDQDGLIVWLCGDRCHRNGKQSAHQCKATADYLKAQAQIAWEERNGTRKQFMARYGRNYL